MSDHGSGENLVPDLSPLAPLLPPRLAAGIVIRKAIDKRIASPNEGQNEGTLSELVPLNADLCSLVVTRMSLLLVPQLRL